MKTSRFDIATTVSLSCFFLISLPLQSGTILQKTKILRSCTFLTEYGSNVAAFVIGCRWNSQLMKYNVLWVISAKRFACGKFIGMYAHCVSSDLDDNLIAGWLVASQVNTCKLCSCELCYNRKDVGAEASKFFLLFSSKKKSMQRCLFKWRTVR